MQITSNNLSDFVNRIVNGERRALSRSITLIESNLKSDQELSDSLLSLLPKRSEVSIRLGITGVPGAGKSTFIEAFGNYITGQGKKVAVLAVDPSSPISGGSILGDKTRMIELTRNENAFIRPSPSSGTLGGVARKTKETILLLEAAGFDYILVETVGVGQSETKVSEITDLFLLVLIAGAGDELQGIKKGIMEIADIILINKADGENKIAAERARHEYESAISYFRPKYDFWKTPVMTLSSINKVGIDEVYTKIQNFLSGSGQKLIESRKDQNKKWLWNFVIERLQTEINESTNYPEIIEIVENFSVDKIGIREASTRIIREYMKASQT